MPIYEFKCPKCGAFISKLCKLGENGTEFVCEKCGHTGLVKQISGFASPGVSGGKSCSTGCGGNCSGCH